MNGCCSSIRRKWIAPLPPLPSLVFRPLPGEALRRAALRALAPGQRHFAVGAGAHLVEAGLADAAALAGGRQVGAAAVLSPAAVVARLALDLALAGEGIVADGELGRLQALQLVAQ